MCGVVYDRLHSRMISTYGGLVNYLPKYSFLFIVFALAGLGLPGTSGFLGEFLVLAGAFKKIILFQCWQLLELFLEQLTCFGLLKELYLEIQIIMKLKI